MYYFRPLKWPSVHCSCCTTRWARISRYCRQNLIYIQIRHSRHSSAPSLACPMEMLRILSARSLWILVAPFSAVDGCSGRWARHTFCTRKWDATHFSLITFIHHSHHTRIISDRIPLNLVRRRSFRAKQVQKAKKKEKKKQNSMAAGKEVSQWWENGEDSIRWALATANTITIPFHSIFAAARKRHEYLPTSTY